MYWQNRIKKEKKEMTEIGKQVSQECLKNNGRLYIFEHRNGKKYAYDGINEFARMSKTDPGNLCRTYRIKTYWHKNWHLIDIIDLINPNWKEIGAKLKGCTVVKRIQDKLDAIERNLIELKVYGYRLWKKVTKACATYLKKEDVARYIEEKRQEAMDTPIVRNQGYASVSYSSMSESDLEDLKERNLRAYEDSLGYA